MTVMSVYMNYSYFLSSFQFSIWAREEAMSSVQYALQKGAAMLDYFDFYFSTKFPLPKMGKAGHLGKY